MIKFKIFKALLAVALIVFTQKANCAEKSAHNGLIVVLNGTLSDKKRQIYKKLLARLGKDKKSKWIGQVVPKTETNEEPYEYADITESKIDRSGTSLKQDDFEDSFDFDDTPNSKMIPTLHKLAIKFNVLYNTFLTESDIVKFINKLEDGGYKVYTINIIPKDTYSCSIHSATIQSPVNANPSSMSRSMSSPRVMSNTPAEDLYPNSQGQIRLIFVKVTRNDSKSIEKMMRSYSSSGSIFEDFAKDLSQHLQNQDSHRRFNDSPKFEYALIVDPENLKAAVVKIQKAISDHLK